MYHDLWGALSAGFLLDLLFGSPEFLNLPEKWIRKLLSVLESRLYKDDDDEKKKSLRGLQAMGALIASVVLIVAAVLLATYYVNRWLFIAVESVMFWGILSVGRPGRAGISIYRALKGDNTEDARAFFEALSGQECFGFDRKRIVSGTATYLSANTALGAAAPLFWMAVGGPAAGWLVKTLSILDRIAMRDRERYQVFGKTWAVFYDVVYYVPVRLAVLVMVAVSGFTGLDIKGAVKIYRRDRKKGERINSCRCESVCAGALGIKLMGPSRYGDVIIESPFVGDSLRIPENKDIKRSRGLMLETAFILYLIFSLCLFIISRT